jgi:hypothetical protein
MADDRAGGVPDTAGMVRRSWLVAVACLALTACGGGGGGGAGEDGESAGDPADRLEAALQDLTDSNTGHFEAHLESLGDDVWFEQGDYSIDPPAYAVTRVHQEGSRTLYVRSVTIGSDSWAGLEDEPGAEPTCWLKGPGDALAGGFATGQVATGLSLPAAVTVPAGVHDPSRGVIDTVRAQADLPAVARLFDAAFPELVALDPDDHAEVPVDFRLDGASFSGWSVTYDTVARAGRAAGQQVDSGRTRTDATYFATLSRLGDPVTIEPPSQRVVDVGEGSMDDFVDAMADCIGPGAGTRP